MKYIRTKDGIFDKIDETMMFASMPPQYELTKNGVHIEYEQCKNCILADTIEELCDWFLTIVNGKINTYSVGFEYAKSHLFLFEKCERVEIKGAIETDKGLIYVAKMNEKGCLELL